MFRRFASGERPDRLALQPWKVAAVPLLVLGLVTLACGSFAPRPTPTPSPARATPIIETGSSAQVQVVEGPTATAALPTSVPTRDVPTPTFTPTPVPGTAIMVGQPARVVALQGLNVRQEASLEAERMGRYAPGTRVSVLEGPFDIDGYRWWRVGTDELVGWVAQGDGEEEWLSPKLGATQPVNRPVRLGDEVIVTVGASGFLKVRVRAGLDSVVDHQINNDSELTIVEGPLDVDGYRWWKVSDGGSVTGWAAEGDDGERWLTPLE